MIQTIVQLSELTRLYRNESVETAALSNVSISIDRSEFVAIMGPSGCGKSTLLNIIGMLDTPTSGRYLFNGDDVSGLTEAQLNRIRKSNVGVIFQSFNLVEHLTVFENVELPLIYQKLSKTKRHELVDQVLKKIGVDHRANHMPNQLSGGQQQRVAVARAVVIEPHLILADEPAGNLDRESGHEVMGLLRQLNEGGSTVVMVTHDPNHAEFASRIIRIADGRIAGESE